MPIDIEIIDSYPQAFINHVQNKMWDFDGLVDKDDMFMTKARLCDGIKEYRPGTKTHSFFLEAIEILMRHSLFAFHVTRLLDTNAVYTNGLQTLESDSHWQRINSILSEHGLADDRVEMAKERLTRMYNGTLGRREGLICLFGPLRFLYGENNVGGYDIMARNYGGEVAQRAFQQSMPDVWNVLANVGTPYVVKTELPFAQISNAFDGENIASEMIMMILYHNYFNLQYQPGFTIHLHSAIPAPNIISIEPIEVLPE